MHFPKRLVAATIGLAFLVDATGTLGTATNVEATVRPEAANATAPSRVLDTRIGLGGSGPIVPGAPLRLPMPASVSGASTVLLNVTATEGATDGWIKTWPCDESPPATSSLNFTPGKVAANAVIVRPAAAGVCFMSSTPVHVVADLSGSFTGSGDLVASPPNRLLDTRVTGDPLIGGAERRLRIAGTPGIGGNAAFAALNLTVDRPGAAGWVVAYPCGQPVNGSTVNFAAGDITANLTLVGLSGGDVCFRAMVDVHLIVDSFGWSTSLGSVRVQSPTRLFDSREAASWPSGQAKSAQTIDLPIAGRGNVPFSATAAFVTVTVARSWGEGYVTVWPCDAPMPTASTINTFPGALRSNLALIKLSADGTGCLRYWSSNASPTDLIVDAVGWLDTGSGPTGPGAPGCGLAAAAFCETFASGASPGGREGDLDGRRWSVTRFLQDTSATNLMAFPSTPVSSCKSGVSSVNPDNDLLVCDSGSGHFGQMLTGFSAQTYGLLSMRPRQPFDFAGRTGTIAYNVDAVTGGPLSWWTSLFVTDDPSAGANNSSQVMGLLPRNGIGINMDDTCGTSDQSRVGVGTVFVYNNYVESSVTGSNRVCVAARRGSVNHVEVRLSQGRVEVWMSDFSSDGRTFPNFRQVFSANISLPFSRGYVHYQQAERAPQKYGFSPGHANNYWSGLAFDGPVYASETGYAVPDALAAGAAGALTVGYGLLNTPYRAVTCCSGGQPLAGGAFSVPGVDLNGATSAQLSFAVQFTNINPAGVTVRYSLNGRPLRTPPQPNYAASQVCGSCPGPIGGGGVLFNFAIPISELQAGTNTILVAVDGTNNAIPPTLSGLDLLVFR